MSDSRCTTRRLIDGGSSSFPPAPPSLRRDSPPRSVAWRPRNVIAFFACRASLLAGRRPGCATPTAASDLGWRRRSPKARLTGLLISCSSKRRDTESKERPGTARGVELQQSIR
jgi:hypothetical protein